MAFIPFCPLSLNFPVCVPKGGVREALLRTSKGPTRPVPPPYSLYRDRLPCTSNPNTFGLTYYPPSPSPLWLQSLLRPLGRQVSTYILPLQFKENVRGGGSSRREAGPVAPRRGGGGPFRPEGEKRSRPCEAKSLLRRPVAKQRPAPLTPLG